MIAGSIVGGVAGLLTMTVSLIYGLIVILVAVGSSLLIGSVCVLIGEIGEDTDKLLYDIKAMQSKISNSSNANCKRTNESWVCVCGTRNSNKNELCSNCGREQQE